MNSCAIHQNSTYALEFGDNFPQPMYIQVGDSGHESSGDPFHFTSDILEFGLKPVPDYALTPRNSGTGVLTWSAEMLEDGSTPSYLTISAND